MLFRSSHPDIDIPTKISAWDWLFNSPGNSETFSSPSAQIKGYTNTETGARITHCQIKDSSIHLSTSLSKLHGLRAGEVVSICSPNSVVFPVAMFGVMRAGGIAALSSPAYGVDEMVHVLKTVECKFVMSSLASLAIVEKAALILGIDRERIFVVDGEVDGFRSLGDLVQEGKMLGTENQVASFQIPSEASNSKLCALLCFSSGTTGLPKAVMISHQNIIAQCLQLLPTTSDDHRTVLGLLPFYHITGVIKMLTLPLVINAEVVILPTFTMKSLLDTITRYRIAEVQVVPPIVIRLVRDPLVDEYDLSCIKRFASGAAPLSQEVLRLVEKKFPGRGFKQGYGMTESTGCITTHPLDRHGMENARTGGTLVANTMVKVVDSEGKVVGVDEKGEILAKGPQIVNGYFNNPKATVEAFDQEGFLRTGDEGFINSEGLITIHDRIKEMIKVKGIQVAPAELEDLLLGHPKIEDCAVIGIPDDYSGERPLGFAVLKPDIEETAETETELLEFVKEIKSRPKWLLGLRIVNQIPKSASGKILRRVLRDEVKLEMAKMKAKL